VGYHRRRIAGGGPGRAVGRPSASNHHDRSVFARMVAGELPPAKAWMEQQLQIEGDFQITGRLDEMFGQASPS
jgi:hypothetical protein